MYLLAAIHKFHGESWSNVMKEHFPLDRQASIAHAVWADITEDITERRAVSEDAAFRFILGSAVAIHQKLPTNDVWFVWYGFNGQGEPITDGFLTLDYIKDPTNVLRYTDAYGTELRYIDGRYFIDRLYRRNYTAPGLTRRLSALGYKTNHPWFDAFVDGVIKYQKHLRATEDMQRKALLAKLGESTHV